jgi:hypothetical protein
LKIIEIIENNRKKEDKKMDPNKKRILHSIHSIQSIQSIHGINETRLFTICRRIIYLLLFLLTVFVLWVTTTRSKHKDILPLLESIFLTKTPRQQPKYDIVYTWVNGEDAKFQSDFQQYVSSLKKTNTEKLPTWGQFMTRKELLYSLCSVQIHLKDIDRIYIIVHDEHELPHKVFYPEWNKKLSKNFRDKIIYIPHSFIIPYRYLPTFNSIVIESFIHYIPNLSEYYVYLNDDMMMLHPYQYDFFFDEEGRPIESREHSPIVSFFTPPSMAQEYDFNDMIRWNNSILNKMLEKGFLKEKNSDRDPYSKIHYMSQHVPSPFRKSWRKELEIFFQTNLPEYYEKTLSSRTRCTYNIAVNSLWKKYWHIYRYGCSSEHFHVHMITISHLDPSFHDSYKLLRIPSSSPSASPSPHCSIITTHTPLPAKQMTTPPSQSKPFRPDILVIQNNIDGRVEGVRGLLGFVYLERIMDVLFSHNDNKPQ